MQQAKRRRTALFVVSSQQDDELERSIQKGLDEQSLRAAAIKHQAEGFKDSNDKLEVFIMQTRPKLSKAFKAYSRFALAREVELGQ